jgi:hypothetical protein
MNAWALFVLGLVATVSAAKDHVLELTDADFEAQLESVPTALVSKYSYCVKKLRCRRRPTCPTPARLQNRCRITNFVAFKAVFINCLPTLPG